MVRVLNHEERAVKKNREEETGVAKGFKEVQADKLEDGRTLMSGQKPNSENVGGEDFQKAGPLLPFGSPAQARGEISILYRKFLVLTEGLNRGSNLPGLPQGDHDPMLHQTPFQRDQALL